MLTNKLRRCDRCGQPSPSTGLGIRDFSFLDGVAPRDITPSNIDGIFHDRYTRRFLIFETKRLGERDIQRGQLELLGALSEIRGFSVFILRELPEDIVQSTNVLTGECVEISLDQLRQWVSRWWREFSL